MARRACVVLVGVAAVLASSGCGQPTRDRPPPIVTCSGSDCINTVIGGGTPTNPDAGGDGAVGPVLPVTLTGRVLWFADDLFGAASPYSAPVTISADASNGGQVSTVFDGVHDFSLPGVLAGPTVWVSAAPESAVDAMTTIVPVPTQTLADVSIPLVRPSALDVIFSALTQPVPREPTQGNVVVFAVKSDTGLPLAGVTVGIAGAGLVAYSVSGTWTDASNVTDATGLALVGNVPAGALPGTLLALEFSGTVTGSFGVRVAGAATTVVRVAF